MFTSQLAPPSRRSDEPEQSSFSMASTGGSRNRGANQLSLWRLTPMQVQVLLKVQVQGGATASSSIPLPKPTLPKKPAILPSTSKVATIERTNQSSANIARSSSIQEQLKQEIVLKPDKVAISNKNIATTIQCSVYKEGNSTLYKSISETANAFQPFRKCDYCETKEGILKCENCKLAYYCGPVCQQAHWPAHKTNCECMCSVELTQF